MTTCRYCGREVHPCANCGRTDGHMVEVHGKWIHSKQVDCIAALRTKLADALERVAELEAMVLEAIPILGMVARIDEPPPPSEEAAP